MNPVRAWVATAATCALVLVASCGGGSAGGDSNNSSSGGNNSISGGNNSGSDSNNSSSGGTGTGGTTGSGTGSTCQPPTVVGGTLFVAEQGPVGVTLLSTGGLSQHIFEFLYDNVFGIPTNNPQDKWGLAIPLLFPPGTPVGASAQVQLQPFGGFVHGEQTPDTFPKGIPIELWLTTNDGGSNLGPTTSSSTASIGKDISHDSWHTASVTYGANNTATVTFFPDASGNHFSVALTNVFGKGLPAGSGSGC